METVHWNIQPVLAGIDTHLNRHLTYAQGCEGMVESLGDVAAVFAGGDGDPHKLEPLRGAVAQLLEARHRSQLQVAVLEDLKGGYKASVEATDFQALLGQRMQQLAAQQPYTPQGDPLMRAFEAAAEAGTVEEGGTGDEQLDDDIAIKGGAHQLAPNATCPITTRPLLQIEDPVQDDTGVVYEWAAVEQFLRTLPPRNGGRAIIMAGTSHQVTLQELVPAEKVIKEKRRQARRQKLGVATLPRGSGGGACGSDDVLDV